MENLEYPPDKEDRELRERHERIGQKWQKQKSKANPCPDCNYKKIGLNDSLLHRWKRFYLECENCHWCGRSKPTIRMAIRAWNKDGRKKYTETLRNAYGKNLTLGQSDWD